MTLEQLKKMIADAGYKVFHSACWESEAMIYAFSVESCGPATYGHPKATACYNKMTGWLTMTGQPSKQLKGGV